MKDFEAKIFGVIFFALWIIVLAHLLTQAGSAVVLAKGVTNAGNSFFGTLFSGKAEYTA